jgi:hypothetical protein
MACEGFEHLLVLYACDELDARERTAVEEHTQQCSACATSLARELRLRQALAGAERPAEKLDPSGLLLAQCRSGLAEALDAQKGVGWWVPSRPASWFALHPAWSAALLLLAGVAAGSVLPQRYRARVAQLPGKPAMTVSASPQLSDQDLQTMGIAAINWLPEGGSGSPSVELHLTAEKPLVVQGSMDDTDVKRVLTYVVQNGQRFDPGVRLDSVDILRTRLSDGDVRRALCTAARKDRNPGVRLKALEALHGFEQDDTVRQTMLDALLEDPNPGVRVEAVNSLQATLRAMSERAATPQDQRAVQVLRDRMQKDPNNYVRMQSAAAMRQLGPREVY